MEEEPSDTVHELAIQYIFNIRRRRRALIGTVSMTTYFHADSALLAQVGTRHVLGVAKALNYRHGYFDQTGELWSPEAQLLASTHQLVYFKD